MSVLSGSVATITAAILAASAAALTASLSGIVSWRIAKYSAEQQRRLREDENESALLGSRRYVLGLLRDFARTIADTLILPLEDYALVNEPYQRLREAMTRPELAGSLSSDGATNAIFDILRDCRSTMEYARWFSWLALRHEGNMQVDTDLFFLSWSLERTGLLVLKALRVNGDDETAAILSQNLALLSDRVTRHAKLRGKTVDELRDDFLYAYPSYNVGSVELAEFRSRVG